MGTTSAKPGPSKGSGEEEPKKHPCRRNSKGIPPNMSMVMVGKTGSGKSATGNTILGRKEFKSMLSDSSVTKTCEKRKGEVAGRHVFVVDTPGLFNTALPSEDIQKELGKCVALSAPGPHVFLLVMEASRFTEEEKRAVEIIQEIFGEGAANYTMVLFTHADQLGDKTIEEYIQGASKELRELVEKCGGRYHAFNNKNMSDRTQVTELLEKIESMVEDNEGSEMATEHKKMKKKREETMHSQRGVEEGETKTQDDSELKIILLGESGAGKSDSRNTILDSKQSGQVNKVEISGKRIQVIDTPSWSNTSSYRYMISEFLLMSSPGPHVFLLVIKIHKKTQNIPKPLLNMKELQRLFGEGVENYVMILFTHGHKLQSKKIDLYIQKAGEELQQLYEQCRKRCHIFNKKKKNRIQVTELLQKIETMVAENRGGYYKVEYSQKEENKHVVTDNTEAPNTL